MLKANEYVCCLNPATGPFASPGDSQLSMHTKTSATEAEEGQLWCLR